jgi:hypothetical protein
MPELPGQYNLAYPIAERADPVSEVERARKLIQDSCKGYKISSVETTEDKIVYTGGTDHAQFVSCNITARTCSLTGSSRRRSWRVGR